MSKKEYPGRQIKKILKVHETFCQCKVCDLKYTFNQLNKLAEMPDDEVVLVIYFEK